MPKNDLRLFFLEGFAKQKWSYTCQTNDQLLNFREEKKKHSNTHKHSHIIIVVVPSRTDRCCLSSFNHFRFSSMLLLILHLVLAILSESLFPPAALESKIRDSRETSFIVNIETNGTFQVQQHLHSYLPKSKKQKPNAFYCFLTFFVLFCPAIP